MNNWKENKEELEKLIKEGISYEEIGRRYGCTGNNIKRAAKRLGIELPVRSKNAGKTPVNKGTKKIKKCLNCGKELHAGNKYCSSKCQHEYIHNLWVKDYKEKQYEYGYGVTGNWGQISDHLRKYIFDKYNNKCCLCGWGETNPYTHTIPLEIDHIDGDYKNNREDNLRLICPNCHSLTENYRGANRGKGRGITWLPITPENMTIEEKIKFKEEHSKG